MVRRLFNIATMLSLALALASAAMWARSKFVTEAWEFKPRPSGMIYVGSGYHEQQAVESAEGRLVYVSYKVFIDATDPPIVGGYQRFADARTPQRPNRRLPDYPVPLAEIPAPTSSGRIPRVAEWYSMPAYAFIPPGRFIAVSWLAVAFAFAALPGGRVWWRWWCWRRSTRPAFTVITSDPE